MIEGEEKDHHPSFQLIELSSVHGKGVSEIVDNQLKPLLPDAAKRNLTMDLHDAFLGMVFY